MPGLVKIGKTVRPVAERIREINNATGVAVDFEILWFVEVRDCHAAERDLHIRLADRRPNKRREFFALSVEEAHAIRKTVVGEIKPTVAPAPANPDTSGDRPKVAATTPHKLGDRLEMRSLKFGLCILGYLVTLIYISYFWEDHVLFFGMPTCGFAVWWIARKSKMRKSKSRFIEVDGYFVKPDQSSD